MVEDLIAKRFDVAIDKGSSEWASLPNKAATAKNGGKSTGIITYRRGKHKGQTQSVPKNADELVGIYNKAKEFYEKQK